ncbi:MAG TPA: hypothetical protein VG963_06245, partial [Polyangiaceae bacterium]|nr:hypothetical protein [Polyangiaceae bacterium]
MKSELLQLSLARLERRRAEGGMAVFLVVLVLTMVSAIGVFAMRSASLVDLATGFNRQSVQSTAMAEYAARAAASYLGQNTNLTQDTGSITGCTVATGGTCVVLKTSLLDLNYQSSAPSSYANGLPGLLSLPSDATQINAQFVTELVDPGMATAIQSPGFEGANVKEITLTSIARV